MNDVENRVVVIARDASLVDAVAAATRSHGLPLRHFESAESWLAEAGDAAPVATGEYSPGWAGCLVMEAPADASHDAIQVGRVCRARKGLPVIVLAHRPTVPGAVATMQAGATTVMEFPCPPDSLHQAITKGLLNAQKVLPQMLRASTAASRLKHLNEGEEAVLEELLSGKANKEIAQKLQLGLRTVELRRSRIMKKMHARSLAELVLLVCEARASESA